MALADITAIYVVAGERRFCPGYGGRPQQDSNLRTRLRRGADQDGADQRQNPQRIKSGRVEGAKPWARGAEVTGAGSSFFEEHPRQASADDDAGKCTDGDPS